MTLRVSSTRGEVVLTLPRRAKLATARAFLEAQAGWIAARMARVPARMQLVAGAVLPLRGQPHQIVHDPTRRGSTRAILGPTGEVVIVVSGDAAAVPGRVRRFLLGEAKDDLTAAVSRYANRLGVVPNRITLRDTTSRWGSCSATGALSFSWRLVMAPEMVLDYLAAHEVAHLKELNHSRRFWSILHNLCPATDEAERWLKRHGTELHRFG